MRVRGFRLPPWAAVGSATIPAASPRAVFLLLVVELILFRLAGEAGRKIPIPHILFLHLQILHLL